MATFFLALAVCMLVHLSAIAAMGAFLGVSVQAFSFGLGPTLYARGRICIRLIPISGFVKFLDTRATEVSAGEMHKAFDRQPLFNMLLICLAGCLVGSALAFALSGEVVLAEMVSAPYQFFAGALSPLEKGKSLMDVSVAFMHREGFWRVLSLVLAKNCAINAMPFPLLNGGEAMACLARHTGLTRWWPKLATQLLRYALLGAMLSWIVAAIFYASSV